MILFAGVKFGLEYKQKLKERTEFLNRIKSGLMYLEGQIVMGEEMLEMGMRECGKRFFEDNIEQDIFSIYADKLSIGEGSSDTCWNDALEEICSSTDVMHEEEKLLLAELAPTLGTADTEHHSSHILNIAQKIEDIHINSENKLKRDGGLVTKLSCAFCAVLILFLW